MSQLFIPILLGTGRPDRESEKAARFVLELAKQQFSTEFVDVKDHFSLTTIAPWQTNPAIAKWRDIVTRADGLIIVTPEYNHGYPGELKILLDQLYDEYDKKPVAVCGVSGGRNGGARVVEQLRLVLLELQMVVMPSAVYFANVKTLFNEDGSITEESYTKKVREMFQELLWFAQTLHYGREHIT